MQFPSLKSFQEGFTETIKRFPFELFFALLGTIVGILFLEEILPGDNNATVTRIIMISNLGLSLSLSLSLYSEARQQSNLFKSIGKVLIILLLLAIYFILNPVYDTALWLRFILFTLSFHLLVAFIPFLGSGRLNGFWQYNKLLFLKICTSVLYSGVLFAGISIAILSLNELFGLHIDGKIYGELWFVIAGIFNTAFFLSGIPDDLDNLNANTDYPKPLKIFTQFVLIPLATIYLGILLVYEIKIVLQWELPKSSVSALILGYAVFGILSILLVYPIRKEEGNRWIYLFSKSFYLLMLPLIVLLILSVWKRVSDYGITEERYFLILLAVWLSFITGYFLLSNSENIRIIPISLCFLALLASYGPQSAFYISKKSQQIRLEKVIESKKDEKRTKEIESISFYLVRNHGLESLQPFVKADVNAIEKYYKTKIGKDSTEYGIYANYNVESDARDSVLKVIDPAHKRYNENSDLDVNYFSNMEVGKINISKPSHSCPNK